MPTLKEKQAYYEYGPPSGWAYKQPPTLDQSLHHALSKVGGGVWKFIWCGAAIVRTDPREPMGRIFGDPDATKIEGGRLKLRQFYGRQRHPRWLCYINDEMKLVRVGREDQVPKGKLTWWEYEYVEYGVLRWFLGRKLTPEQLVACREYSRADVPREGSYLIKEAYQDAGKYSEPTLQDVERVREHLHEETTMSLNELLERDREMREAIALEIQTAEDTRDLAQVGEMVEQMPPEQIDEIVRQMIHKAEEMDAVAKG
jgi:hypothetical protein